MNKNKELEVLFHAFNLENSFYSTKISSLFKLYSENASVEGSNYFDRDALIKLVGLPGDEAWELAQEEIYQAQAIGIQVISFLDDNYPKQLFEIPDPPLVLFISSRSDFLKSDWERLLIWGIVGSRNPSRYGVEATIKLGSELSKNGVTVVSGLAYGIDKAAHQGSLLSLPSNNILSCPTIAVLGSGLLEIYPGEHRGLAKEIIDNGGCLISEYGLRKTSRPYLFPRRNRIVSGLSRGVVIIEAKKKSGSLITARLALEQGREVYCLPGPIDSPLSEGGNQLINDGAGVIVSIEDFVAKFRAPNIKSKSMKAKLEIVSTELNAIQKKLVNKLNKNDFTFDELVEIGLTDQLSLRREILDLELKGYVENVNGFYSLIKS